MADLKALVEMSRGYGGNPEFVLAGGGNTSMKTADTLYVKCSGTKLGTIDEAGFVPVSRAALQKTMEKRYPDGDAAREAAFLADVMAARTQPGERRRPSVEALLHSLFPQKYVLHLHPAMVNGLTCSVDGEAVARSLYGDAVLWIPILRPGYVLGKRCAEKMADYARTSGRDAQVVLLQNHGIFVAGDTVEEVGDCFSTVMEQLEKAITVHPELTTVAGDDTALAERIKRHTGRDSIRYGGIQEVLRLTASREAAAVLLAPFTPDHIVYCGAHPLYLERPEDVETISPGPGKIVLVKDVGFYALGDSQKAADTAAMLFTDGVKIAVYAENFGGPLHMTEEMTDFIVNWEAESYRKSQSQNP